MATWQKIAFVACRTIYGTPLPSEQFPEAANQVFEMGAPCVLTGGYLTECGADPASICGVATREGQNGATSGAKRQVVNLAVPGSLFRGYIDTSAAEGTGVTAAANLGKAYGIAKNAATGKWYVDNNDVANDRVIVWKHWDGDGMAIGDTQGHVVFSFLASVSQMLVGV
jgi:hypothetical protein